MKQGMSEIIGKAHGAGKSSVMIYRALRQILCAACGEGVSAGALFTRRSLSDRDLRILPQCQKCAPFDFQDASEEDQHRSALMESLLTPELEERSDKVQKRDMNLKREAIERRLLSGAQTLPATHKIISDEKQSRTH